MMETFGYLDMTQPTVGEWRYAEETFGDLCAIGTVMQMMITLSVGCLDTPMLVSAERIVELRTCYCTLYCVYTLVPSSYFAVSLGYSGLLATFNSPPLFTTFRCNSYHSNLSDCANPSGVTTSIVHRSCTSNNVLEIECSCEPPWFMWGRYKHNYYTKLSDQHPVERMMFASEEVMVWVMDMWKCV